MRTSISLDDRLAERVRRRAASQGVSVSAFIASILDDALKQTPESVSPPFRLITAGGTGVYPGVDLDRPRELIAAEDAEQYGPRRGP